MTTPLSRATRALPPRGTTLVAGETPSTAFWHGLLRGLVKGLLRGLVKGLLRSPSAGVCAGAAP